MDLLVVHDGNQEAGEVLVMLLELRVEVVLAGLFGLVDLRFDSVGCVVDNLRDLFAARVEGIERLLVVAVDCLTALLYLALHPVEIGSIVLGFLDLLGAGQVVCRAVVVGDDLLYVGL